MAEFENGTLWKPEIISYTQVGALMGFCEDLKYPNGKGRGMLKEFWDYCIDTGLLTREEILYIYRQHYDPNKKKVYC